METNYTGYYPSPIGVFGITCNEHSVIRANFTDALPLSFTIQEKTPPILAEALCQIAEYFEGVRQQFDLPLEFSGPPFYQKVWQELIHIPYGETCSYGALAARVGNTKASRAVGLANNRNPISIIIPCHRVIGANGKLVGYGGGLHRKEWLLQWEREKI